MADNPEPAGAQRADIATRFQPGNPGRQKGSRNKLTEDFLGDVLSAWGEKGKQAIDDMIADKPGDFVKMVAGIVPKDHNININNADELSDAELAERIRTLAAQFAPFLPGGAGDADGASGGTEGAQLPSRVH